MSEATRQELRDRIAAGRSRLAERTELSENAAAARDRLTAIAREHPLMIVAGGIVIGVALSALIPRSPTRRLSKNALGMIVTVAQLGLAYSKQAMEAADEASQPARGKMAEVGSAIADRAAKIREKVTAGD